MFNIAYIWENALFVSMEEISIFDIILGNGFYEFIALFANSKDALSQFVLFGKFAQNIYDKKQFRGL